MVKNRQSRLKRHSAEILYGTCNLSGEIFHYENYIYIEYGQLWLVFVSAKKELKSLPEEQTPCHSLFSDGLPTHAWPG